MRRAANLLSAVTVSLLTAGAVRAQVAVSPLDGTTPGINAPGSPDTSYRLGDFDTVNPGNGHLNIAIPLVAVPGRGDAKASLVANVQSTWHVQTVQYSYSCATGACLGVGYIPINEPWDINSQPTFAQGVVGIRSSGETCNPSIGSTPQAWQEMLTRLTYIGPDGTEHEMRDAKTGGRPLGVDDFGSPTGTFDLGPTFLAYDSSDATFISSSDIKVSPSTCPTGAISTIPTGTLHLKNGTTYTIGTYGYVNQIEDRNGNLLTLTNPTGLPYPMNITDALGRTTTASAISSNGVQTITYPDAAGNNHVITLTYQPLSYFVSNPGFGFSALQTTAALFGFIPYCTGITCSSAPQPQPYSPGGLLASVQYPDNTTLSLSYNAFGDVAYVILPTGGIHVYSYSTWWAQTGSNIGSSPGGFVIERRVTEKDIYANASDYLSNPSNPAPPAQKIFFCGLLNGTVSAGLAGRIVYTSGTGSYNCTSGAGSGILGIEDHFVYPPDLLPPFLGTYYETWLSGKEYQTTYYDNNGVVLKSTATTWAQRPCSTGPWWAGASAETTCWFGDPESTQTSSTNSTINAISPVTPLHDPYIQSATTTLGTGAASLTSSVGHSIDQYNNEIEQDEYGFGALGASTPGSLYRKTVSTYQYGSQYLSAYLFDLPATVQTQDGANNWQAETDYTYDGSSLTSYSTILQHDPAYSASNTTRGNPTTVTRIWNDTVNGISKQPLPTQFAYDIAGNVVSEIDPRGVQHTYGYADNVGNNSYAFPTSVTSYTGLNGSGTALSASVTYNYSIGKPISTKDVNGNTSTYQYSTSSNCTNITSVNSSGGMATTDCADPFDRLDYVSHPDGGSTTIAYTDTPGSFSVQSSVAQSSGTPIVTTTGYDGLGRKSFTQLSENDGSSIFSTYAYDGRGRQQCASLPFRSASPTACSATPATTTAYDGLNRPVQVTESDGSNTYTSYGASQTAAGTPGYQTLVQDPANFWKRSTADGFGRLIEVQENPKTWLGSTVGNGSLPTYTTTYGYDLLDDLTSVAQTDPTANLYTISRSFTYDSLKRLVVANNPESGRMQYEYDQSGNLTTKIDGVRTVNFAAYDGMNRIVGKSYTPVSSSTPSTPTVYYYYGDGSTYPSATNCNGLGRLTAVVSGTAGTAGSAVNQYPCFDTMGRVASSSQTIGTNTAPYPFKYLYDISGELHQTTYPSGRIVTNAYDAAGRICGVANGATASCTGPSQYANVMSPSNYAPQGTIQTLGLNNNSLVENWTYNTRQQPTGLTATANNTPLLTLGWTYGGGGTDNGNILTHTIQRSTGLGSASTVLTENFSYADPANRLSAANEGLNVWQQTYSFDAFGNRAVTAGTWLPGQTVPNPGFTPQALSQFTVQNQWVRGSADQYDAAGNQTQWAAATAPYNQVGSTFTFDGENHMLTANVAGEGGASYVYDGEGRRVQKTVGTVTTTYVHDAAGLLAAEYSTAAPTANGTEYLTADHLGSTRLVTTSAGAPLECLDFLPFGEQIPSGIDGRSGCYTSATYPAAPDIESQKFTGKERDAETGLDYFGARYFSAMQGRFTGADGPLIDQHTGNPQSWNLYAYVRDNPLGGVDLDGHAGPLQRFGCDEDEPDCQSNPALQVGQQQTQPAQSQNGKRPSRRGTAVGGAKELANTLIPFSGPVGILLDLLGLKFQAASPSEQAGMEIARRQLFLSSVLPGPGMMLMPEAEAPALAEFVAGGKTSGVLRTAAGDTDLLSGWEGPASSMPKGSSGFDIVTRTHVEGHAAALMRQQGATGGTLFINNPAVCSSCTRLLPSMLPSGVELRVVLPDGTVLPFTGRP
jgi:RHS repeat-associated protein